MRAQVFTSDLKSLSLKYPIVALVVPLSIWILRPFGIRFEWSDILFHSLLFSYGGIVALVLLLSNKYLKSRFIKASFINIYNYKYLWPLAQAVLVVVCCLSYFLVVFSSTAVLVSNSIILKAAVAAFALLYLVLVPGAREYPHGEVKSNNHNYLHLHGKGANEHIQLQPQEFLMAKSADNYVEVAFLRQGIIHKQLLRVTLRDLEGQLADKNIIKCHRSYLVNMRRVADVQGQSRLLKLKLDSLTVPVSRQHVQKVKSAFRKLPISHKA